MQVFEIDGYDLAAIIDVQDGGGFDPTPDFLEFQFGEAALSEGQPRLSTAESNREWVVPVHVAPAKLGFTDSVDGLRSCVIDLNRRLAAAARLAWRDEGATNRTYYDIEAAKFEPDYRHFRARQKWLSGTLRVWTRPYGTTGTYRTIATAAASSTLLEIPLRDLDGDAGALLTCAVNVPTYPYHVSGSVIWHVAVAVAAASQRVRVTPSQAFAVGSAAQTTDAYAVSSQAMRMMLPAGDVENEFVQYAIAKDYLPDRARILAIARTGETAASLTGSVFMRARDSRTLQTLGPTVCAGGNASGGYRVYDLGVLTVSDRSTPTQLIGIVAGGTHAATRVLRLSEIYLLPEDSTTYFQHGAIGQLGPSAPLAALACSSYMLSGASRTFTAVSTPSNVYAPYRNLDESRRGQMPQASAGLASGAQKLVVFAAANAQAAAVQAGGGTLSADVRCVERFTFAR